MTSLKLANLSSCEDSRDYYNLVLRESSSGSVEYLEIEVDIGVDFEYLSDYLSHSFPNLKSLTIEQNSAHGKKTSLEDFVSFLADISLEKFTLVDFQSNFLKGLDPLVLFSMLPYNCTYTIFHGGNPTNNTCHIDIPNNKYLVYSF